MDAAWMEPTTHMQVWKYAEQHYVVLYGTGWAMAALGPMSFDEALAIVQGDDAPRPWDEDLADELDEANNRGEVEIGASKVVPVSE